MIQYKWLLLLAVIMTVGSNLLALVGPMLSGYAIDAIEPGMGKVEFSRVFHYAGWMAAFYVISSVLSYALSVLMITISRKVVYRMRKDVFDKMLALPRGITTFTRREILSAVFPMTSTRLMSRCPAI